MSEKNEPLEREQVWQGKIVGADCSSGDTFVHLDCLVPIAVGAEYALIRIHPRPGMT
jgi:hypothetical protein